MLNPVELLCTKDVRRVWVSLSGFKQLKKNFPSFVTQYGCFMHLVRCRGLFVEEQRLSALDKVGFRCKLLRLRQVILCRCELVVFKLKRRVLMQEVVITFEVAFERFVYRTRRRNLSSEALLH